MWVESTGTLRASVENGVYRLALDVDPGIVELARALVPRYIRLQRQKFAPHISVVRETQPVPGLLAYDGREVGFTYCPEVVPGEVYYWLRAESQALRAIRVALGLPEMAWYTYPPDLEDVFHCTIGNLKGS